MLGRLHDADAIVAHQRHRARKEIRRRHEVGVEDRYELRRIGELGHFAQGVVDVARLGVGVVGARDIAATQPLAQSPEPRPAAVVEHPDAVIGVIHAGGADDGALEDAFFLVVRTNEEIDQRLLRQRAKPWRVAVGFRRPVARARQEDQRQRRRDEPARLDQQEGQAEGEIEREARRRQRRARAPEEVAHEQRQAQRHHGEPHRRRVAPHGCGEREAGAEQRERRPKRGEKLGRADPDHGRRPSARASSAVASAAAAPSSKVTLPVRPTTHSPLSAIAGTATVT